MRCIQPEGSQSLRRLKKGVNRKAFITRAPDRFRRCYAYRLASNFVLHPARRLPKIEMAAPQTVSWKECEGSSAREGSALGRLSAEGSSAAAAAEGRCSAAAPRELPEHHLCLQKKGEREGAEPPRIKAGGLGAR